MNWLQGWRTIQPEEIVWLLVTGYAVVFVHLRAMLEATQDEHEAKANNHHLPVRVRDNAAFLARARKRFERRLMTAQSVFFITGMRSLFFPANADRSRSLVAVGLLVLGELMIVSASQAMSHARQVVRENRVPKMLDGP